MTFKLEPTYLVLQLLGLLLRLKGDKPVALGRAAAVGDDLGGADVAVLGEELVQVSLRRCVADAANEDSVRDEGPVLDAAAGAAAVQDRVGVGMSCCGEMSF